MYRVRGFNTERDFVPEGVVFSLEGGTVYYLTERVHASKVLLDEAVGSEAGGEKVDQRGGVIAAAEEDCSRYG